MTRLAKAAGCTLNEWIVRGVRREFEESAWHAIWKKEVQDVLLVLSALRKAQHRMHRLPQAQALMLIEQRVMEMLGSRPKLNTGSVEALAVAEKCGVSLDELTKEGWARLLDEFRQRGGVRFGWKGGK